MSRRSAQSRRRSRAIAKRLWQDPEYHTRHAAGRRIRFGPTGVTVPLIIKPGWPKKLPCLRCDRRRTATGPEDRMCDTCRHQTADLQYAPEATVGTR